MNFRRVLPFLAAVMMAFGAMTLAQQSSQMAQDKILRLNQIQVIGTHNSYHAGFAPSERRYLEKRNPDILRGLDYRHAPLADQLSSGVRQIEIDVFSDPQGGRFAHPAMVEKVAAEKLPADPDFDPHHEMDKPGFKVMHIPDIDQRSNCLTLVGCLKEVRIWSKGHPWHLPIFILIETKEFTYPTTSGAVRAEPFTSADFDALDAEIRSVFQAGEIITPDEVRGNAATLVESVHAGRWPTLAEARGRVIFLMDQQHVGPIYTQGHPSLRGRILFTNAVPGAPDAAFVERNDGSVEEIDALVKEGYLVRTRTDEPTQQARTNDTRRSRSCSFQRRADIEYGLSVFRAVTMDEICCGVAARSRSAMQSGE
jgi:hypothetical protein